MGEDSQHIDSQMMGWCLQAIRSYRGPLIAIGLGIGFVLVGAVPVAVTFSINAKGSATIIGVGFIGFGLLLILPGIGWCIVRRACSLRCCRSHTERLRPDDEYAAEEELPGIERKPSVAAQPRATYILTSDQIIKSAAYFDAEQQNSSAKDPVVEDQDETIEEDVSQDNGDIRLTR